MTTVYLVRHGQSVANEKDLFIGHTDMPLTQLGKSQAQKAAGFFNDIKLDAIYSSDLSRAHCTAEYTAKAKGLKITVTQQLRDIYAGAWEGMPFCDIPKKYPDDYELWLNDIDLSRCTSGESVIEVRDRMLAILNAIASQNSGKTVAIFTHAMPIRALIASLSGSSVKQLPWPTNASVTKCVFDNGKITELAYSMDNYLAELITALPDNV